MQKRLVGIVLFVVAVAVLAVLLWRTLVEPPERAALGDEAAQAQLLAARVDLAYTDIRAPISGVIGRALKVEGALANASGDSLLLLIRYADMKACDETVHEKLKALKRQREWYPRRSAQVTTVDITTAAAPRRQLSAWWFIPPLVVSLVPVVLALTVYAGERGMSAPIRLAFFIDDLGIGGTQTWLTLLARALDTQTRTPRTTK